METRAMKLLVHSFCADVHPRGGLELCSYWQLLGIMHLVCELLIPKRLHLAIIKFKTD